MALQIKSAVENIELHFGLRAVWLVHVVTNNKCLSNRTLRIMSPGRLLQGHSFMSAHTNTHTHTLVKQASM